MATETSGGSSAFVAVDVETTGFLVGTDRVYEVAIVGFDTEGKETWTCQSLCRPPGALSRRLHPVDAAPSFADIAGDVVGVDVDGFHSATTDARAAGIVPLEISRIADERGLLDAVRVPSTFRGSATDTVKP